MPPLRSRENVPFDAPARRLRSQGICPECLKVVPRTPRRWDSRREMCRLCAMNAAENEGHRRARLTLRLPPRAHKTCTLCLQNFVVPLATLDENGDPSRTRCAPCQKREKCTTCCKLKKRKHFRKGDRIQLYKTCNSCRDRVMARVHRKRAQAEIQGEYMRIFLTSAK